MMRTSTQCVDVLSTWELSATPFQLRVENLYIGERSELIQNFVQPDDPSVPIILGIRAFAQLVMENKKFCDPVVSDLGHLEILRKPGVRTSPSEDTLLSHLPQCYTVNFSSVFTFPLNISDLSPDSRVELSLHCLDLGVQIGHISILVFAATGVLRQGRFLLPFGLSPNHGSSSSDDFSRSSHGVCDHCAASSRFVSHLGCLSECPDYSHATDDDSDFDSDFDSDYDSDSDHVPTAQSILSLFLGDRRAKRRRRQNQRPKDKIISRSSTPTPSEPDSFRTCRLSASSNNNSTDQTRRSSSSISEEESDGILVSSGSITCWSSSEDDDGSESPEQTLGSTEKQSQEEEADTLKVIGSKHEKSVEESIEKECIGEESDKEKLDHKKSESPRHIRLISFRGVSNAVYRAMNCYKLLDLSHRGVIGKCPYTKGVCREQVQIQCEKNLAKGLLYFGFCAICLPVFPSPVIFSTTPPLRVEESEEKKPAPVKSSSTWLTGGTSWPLIGGAVEETSTVRHRRNKSIFASTDPIALIDPYGMEEDQTTQQRMFDRRRVPTMLNNECAQWYLETFEVSSWDTRRSILAMAQNIAIQNAMEESFNKFDDPKSDDIGPRSLSVPSIYERSSLQWPANTLHSSVQWSNLSTHPPTRQMRFLQRCWSSQSEPYSREQHCNLERLFIQQQRKLALSAMDRQRILADNSARDNYGRFGELTEIKQVKFIFQIFRVRESFCILQSTPNV